MKCVPSTSLKLRKTVAKMYDTCPWSPELSEVLWELVKTWHAGSWSSKNLLV